MPTTTQIDELLSNYIDLMNSEGPTGSGPRAFEKKHADNKQLMQLIAGAKQVQGLFASGQLGDKRPDKKDDDRVSDPQAKSLAGR